MMNEEDPAALANPDRPSHHGAALGEALATIAEANPVPGATPCIGCAFRRGSYANQSAATVQEAMHCITDERDTSVFMCHHGLKDGQPTQPCLGYENALRAPFPLVQRELLTSLGKLKPEGDNRIRAETDAWLAEVDPHNRLNAYERGALWSRRGRP